jgi:fatty-acyl-CoA synthase
MSKGMYEEGLEKTAANFTVLTPLTFIERAASVYPAMPAIAHGAVRRDWAETYARVRRLASALSSRGIGIGDTVAAMLPNIPEMIEAHFGIPMIGAVLNTLNTRLDANTLAFMLNHGEAKAVLVDREFSAVMREALAQVSHPVLVIDVDDTEYDGAGERIGELDYEALLASGDPAFEWTHPSDEWNAICLNYTSGTTGHPKGVVYHHRGAYTNAISNILEWDMPKHAVYLWTLPMFHCNGWCFPWTVAARAGVNVCLRKVDARTIFDLIRRERVTHYCGAPIVQNLLVNAPGDMKEGIAHIVHAMVAGAAPPAAMIEGMERLGFELTHVYGLTEVYGPATVCARQAEWSALDVSERARLNARQGVRYHLQDAVTVRDPLTMLEVPADGETIGEIMFRGNIAMKGYLKNAAATREALSGGWFHTGDLAVTDADGYVRIKDRSKDIIISGGENISSIEIEDVLYRHPAVLAAAVVAKPDERWGETPCAFVELKADTMVSAAELIQHCRLHLAGFKVPRAVEFCELPKTLTGKIQKFELRKRAGTVAAIDA